MTRDRASKVGVRLAVAALGMACVLSACTASRRDDAQGTSPLSASVGTASLATGAATPMPRAPAAAGGAPPHVAIATGGVRETDYRIGQDLAAWVAPDAGIALDVLATSGSADNVHRLADEPAVGLAIVQYDVVQALVEQAAAGNATARRLVKPLRVVTPLYAQEIYFVARSDAKMASVDDIRGVRINVGVQGSGSALTVATLYRKLFGVALPPRNVSYLTDEEALGALTAGGTIDVMVVVAAQPAKLFADMKPQARDYIKLLPLDPKSPSSAAASKIYFPATIRARNYAQWLTADVPTLSVMSFLVTSDLANKPFAPFRAAFAQALCTDLSTLKADGHPKWREVPLGERFGQRWAYDAASSDTFARCTERRPLSAGRP